MQTIGYYLKKHSLTTLINSESTYNFMDTKLAHRLKCHIIVNQMIKVMIANGGKLTCSGHYSGLSLTLHDFHFEDLYFLPLGGCNVVLVAQWLHTLNPIL